jgi:hypothetical protein
MVLLLLLPPPPPPFACLDFPICRDGARVRSFNWLDFSATPGRFFVTPCMCLEKDFD